MKVKAEVNEKVNCDLGKSKIEKIIQVTIEKSELDFLFEKKIKVSIASISQKEIKEINEKYRNKNEVTDILSFQNYENMNLLKTSQEKEIFLGEILICCDYIKKSAKINNIEYKNEICYIISHGILHLLGFSHGAKMFSIQDEVNELVN